MSDAIAPQPTHDDDLVDVELVDASPLERMLVALEARVERLDQLVDEAVRRTRGVQRSEPERDGPRALTAAEALAHDDNSTLVQTLASRCHRLDYIAENLTGLLSRLEL